MNIAIKKLHSQAILPGYQTIHSAAADVAACLDEPIELHPMERCVIPTGFALSLPAGYEAQIRARSGLSLKHGICMANGVGTIDADYRGEIGIILINLGKEPFTVQHGMRIAQMVIARHETVEFEEVSELDATKRNVGGYGSTGT